MVAVAFGVDLGAEVEVVVEVEEEDNLEGAFEVGEAVGELM